MPDTGVLSRGGQIASADDWVGAFSKAPKILNSPSLGAGRPLVLSLSGDGLKGAVRWQRKGKTG
jgi:hypothetical protein